MPPGVVVLPDPSAVARRGAQELVHLAQRSIAARGTFIIALSGGSTPKAMYELLASDEELHSAMPWWQTHFFWGDERHVPPDSPDSNYRMAHEAMLAAPPTPARNVHRVMTEMGTPAEVANAYEKEIHSTFQQLGRNAQNVPAFDLLLLGMGSDGHTASLFPHTTAINEQSCSFTENQIDKLNSWRFTIPPPVIDSAEHVMLLVTGSDKSAMLRQVFLGPYEPAEYPVQLVTRRHRPTIWLLDEAAASELK